MNFIRITIRRLMRQKLYSFINIFSLVLGLTCSIFILLWVFDELSYDKFHKNIQDIYRVNCVVNFQNTKMDIPATSHPMASLLKQRIGEIKATTRLRDYTCVIKHEEIVFSENAICFADPEFFNIFTLSFLQGNSQTVLENPNSVVISKSIAEKYFPSIDPVGKILAINNQLNLQITGVYQDFPNNSSLDMDFIVSYPSLTTLGISLDGWSNIDCITFVQTQPNADVNQIEPKMTKEIIEASGETAVIDKIKLDPLRKIHLYLEGGNGDIRYVYIFSIIAGIVLILGCINFMNLSTAQSTKRAKEVGLKKTTGSTRRQLITQFFGESMLMVLIALILSLIIIELLLPYFNNFLQKQISLSAGDFWIIYIILGITLITGIISASYPAVYLSSFQAAIVLRSEPASKLAGKKLRQFLVISQFIISIVLIISTLIMTNQIKYLQNKKLGLNKDHIIYLPLHGSMVTNFPVFKNKLLQRQDTQNVTIASSLPSNITTIAGGLDWDNRNPKEEYLFNYLLVDQDFFKTFDINLAQGRFFSNDFSTEQNNYILNERAITQMGIEDPIGKCFSMWGTEGKIVGVVKDFHFQPLNQQIGPMLFAPYPRLKDWFEYIFIKYNSDNVSETLETIRNIHSELNPNIPFDYHFLDSEYATLYQSEIRVLSLVEWFSFLAILISCLGLLGLSSFLVEKRTKEIGIRKVNGATVPGILSLLTRDFMKWVLVAFILACPVAYFCMDKWLQNFAYRMEISWWTFVLAGIGALIIALLTVGWQSFKAANRNPVKALRYE